MFDRSHRLEENEHFIKKTFERNKLAIYKLVLTYNVSMGAGNMGTGSKLHATYRQQCLDGF